MSWADTSAAIASKPQLIHLVVGMPILLKQRVHAIEKMSVYSYKEQGIS
jgi:hypothetical protein